MTKKEIIITIVVSIILLSIIIITKIPKKYYLSSNYYKGNEFIETTGIELDSLLGQEKSMIVFTNNSYCIFEVPCDEVYKDFMKKYNIQMDLKSWTCKIECQDNPQYTCCQNCKTNIPTHNNPPYNDDLAKLRNPFVYSHYSKNHPK
jgi:hypothetical protein